MTQKERLIGALAHALDEIHNPGAAHAQGVDILKMINTVLYEATKLPQFKQE
jgi:hypothetical protein